MEISSQARNITVPLVEFGGFVVLSRLRRRNGVAYPQLQDAYYRAGHAHAGVLVILAILAQLLIDVADFASSLDSAVRAGFFLAPILIPAGFFLGTPGDTEQPGRLINLIHIGALLLAASALTLGVTLAFG